MDFCTIDNGRFLAYPVNKVIGVVNDASAAEATVNALTAAGVEQDKIEVLCGQAAASQLDTQGKSHGVLGRLVRAVQQVADGEGETLRRHQQELEAGRFMIAAPAASHDAAQNVRQILKANGGHYINYYTRFAVELMDS